MYAGSVHTYCEVSIYVSILFKNYSSSHETYNDLSVKILNCS